MPPPKRNEVGTCKGIPCTSPSRTIVDLAGMLGVRSLRAAVERAAVLRMLDLSAIDRSLAAHRRRGAPALRALLRSWRLSTSEVRAGGATRTPPRLRSELEARLFALIRASDLPTPTCNQRIEVGNGGQVIEVDFLWPGQRLVVEVDGWRFHDGLAAFERDRHRDRALHLAGYRVVRFTYAQIDAEPGEIVTTIHRLLASDFG